jgi:hypothetical protein
MRKLAESAVLTEDVKRVALPVMAFKRARCRARPSRWRAEALWAGIGEDDDVAFIASARGHQTCSGYWT